MTMVLDQTGRQDGRPEEPPDAAADRPGRVADARTATLLDLVLRTTTVEDHLAEVARMGGALSEEIGGCGITLQRRGEVYSVATSNPLAASADELQYGEGAGPCLETLSSGDVVVVSDYLVEDRWDRYPAHALAHGVRSSLSAPLTVAGRTVGALNVYGLAPALFEGSLKDRLLDFATQAQAALALALRHAEQAEVVEQLHSAMQSRSVIDQALGILMARQACSAGEAFAVLRKASQARNRKVADIAADLITAATGTAPQPGRFDV